MRPQNKYTAKWKSLHHRWGYSRDVDASWVEWERCDTPCRIDYGGDTNLVVEHDFRTPVDRLRQNDDKAVK